jgi:hypothetical protein
VPAADGAVVVLFYPVASFAWVSAFCPSPKRLKDGMVYGSKGVLTGAVLVVVRPATNNRVEQLDQSPSACLSVAFDDRSHFRQHVLGALLRWRGQEFALVFAYPKAQEIKSVLDVSDAGLFCGEGEPSLPQKLLDQRFDFLFEEFF